MRRSIPLVAAVVALLVVVALVAGGRPLGTGGASGGGPTSTFWNYAFTTLLVAELLAVIGAFWVAWAVRPDLGKRRAGPAGTIRALAVLLTLISIGFYARLHFLHNHPAARSNPRPHQQTGTTGTQSTAPGRHRRQELQVQWEELVVVFGLLTALVAAYVVRRKRLGAGAPWRRLGAAPEAAAAALDESLDDLRADPDLRRAIVAAYARMEKALATAGVPRRPAEAPLEYLERVLLSLDASAGAVRRLTDLFEWARFSHHEPEPSMRDEAVDALVAVRDELRAEEPVETW